jgi:hypothetical protein
MSKGHITEKTVLGSAKTKTVCFAEEITGMKVTNLKTCPGFEYR